MALSPGLPAIKFISPPDRQGIVEKDSSDSSDEVNNSLDFTLKPFGTYINNLDY